MSSYKIYDSTTKVWIFSLIDTSLPVEIVQKLQLKLYHNQHTPKPSRIIQRGENVD